jgi:hypothetical protein
MAEVSALRQALIDLDVTASQLWITYFSVGGNRDAAHIVTYLSGDVAGSDVVDHDHVIDALNDLYFDRGFDHPLAYGTT